MARPYPVYEAKAKLSQLLRQVKRGRSVTISERGTEVARIVPVQAPRDLDSRLERLEHDGVVLQPQGTPEAVRPLVRKPGALRRFLNARA
jgi:prevent-host-death family protein